MVGSTTPDAGTPSPSMQKLNTRQQMTAGVRGRTPY